HCTACGRRVPSEATYCAYCGEEMLKDRDLPCPTCKKLLARSAKYCPNCGSRLPSTRQDPSPLLR
ncbi:MAG: double zinc ribbon domain-containing protein, partial [Nitrososphaerales archaeon]